MRKYTIRIFYILTLIGIIFCILTAANTSTNIYNPNEDSTVENWSETMDVALDGTDYTYTTTLPSFGISTKVISFYSIHAEAEVYVGNTLVYFLYRPEHSFTKTPGYRWNFVSLREEYAGQTLTIRLHGVYDAAPPAPVIYYGCYSPTLITIISDNIVDGIVSAAMLIIGSALFLYSVFIIGNKGQDQSLLHFSIFTLLLGIWVFSDSSICALLLPWSTAHVLFAHVSLMMLPIPFMLIFQHNCQSVHTSPFWSVYCFISCISVTLRLILQLTGLRDFKETLWMTHLLLFAFAVVGVGFSIHNLMTNKITNQIRLNIVCICIILFATVLDLVQYAITKKSSSYTALGFLAYICIMGVNIFYKSYKMMERARQNEIYRKLAYTDELTGLFNRTAFKRDMENQIHIDKSSKKISITPTAIFMFDLNDLKNAMIISGMNTATSISALPPP